MLIFSDKPGYLRRKEGRVRNIVVYNVGLVETKKWDFPRLPGIPRGISCKVAFKGVWKRFPAELHVVSLEYGLVFTSLFLESTAWQSTSWKQSHSKKSIPRVPGDFYFDVGSRQKARELQLNGKWNERGCSNMANKGNCVKSWSREFKSIRIRQ